LSSIKTTLLSILALLAFAANSVLCRLALDSEQMDAANFTAIRLLSAAAILALLLFGFARLSINKIAAQGSWKAAFYLLAYAAGFSYAYVSLPTAAGALILFASVQFTMLAMARFSGKIMTWLENLGFGISIAGLAYFLLPGLLGSENDIGDISGILFMTLAGVGWGFYSLCGAKSAKPMQDTAANFIRLTPVALVILLFSSPLAESSSQAIGYAIASGALTSGLGYTLWYHVLPKLHTSVAAVCQLSVPIWTGLGGALLVGEALEYHLLISAGIILGGILLVIFGRPRIRANTNSARELASPSRRAIPKSLTL
jgi:drug/metabolite transporter (DMT)-like permease